MKRTSASMIAALAHGLLGGLPAIDYRLTSGFITANRKKRRKESAKARLKRDGKQNPPGSKMARWTQHDSPRGCDGTMR